MWYGVLGTKELVQKTYKNLEQRVQLEVSLTHAHTHTLVLSDSFSSFLTLTQLSNINLQHSVKL